MNRRVRGHWFAGVLVAGTWITASAQVIPLYDGVAPGSEGWTQKEGSFDLTDTRFNPPNPDTLIWNVTKPTLTVFKPAAGKSNGTAIVVAPGGGFRVLSYVNEGTRVAKWLKERGITVFILKYRLNRMPDDPAEVQKDLDRMLAATQPRPGASGSAPPPPMPRMEFGPVEKLALSDGVQAVKMVRMHAKEFGIDPQRVGIIGFSAGGAVSGGSTVSAAPADRANFVGVIYAGVPGNLPPKLPPAFFAAAADDPLSASMPELFTRWRATGAAAELHIYAEGRHGFGTVKQGLPVDGWLDAFFAWLGQQGFVPKPH
jgi:acetyl esterase/lipase